MSGEFAYWDHVRGFLEFESLLVDESALLVDDDVWIHWTGIAVFSRKLTAIASTWEGNSSETMGYGNCAG